MLICILCHSQIIDGKRYNSSVDWFSFGVVLYEMIVGRLPFDGNDEDEMFQRICEEEPKFPKVIHSDAASCLKLVRLQRNLVTTLPLHSF